MIASFILIFIISIISLASAGWGHAAASRCGCTQASHQCLRSLRWLWLSLTRQCAHLQDGETPLHRAANEGEEGAIGVLLAAGADRQAKNNVSGDRRGLVMRGM